jgi:hypothetical protein
MPKLLTIGFLLFSTFSISQNCVLADFPLDASAVDASGNGISGILNGPTGATDHQGNANSAISFDGQNDFVEFNAGSPLITSNSEFTFFVRAKMSGPGGGTLGQSPLFVQRVNAVGVGGSIVMAMANNGSNQISFVIRDNLNSVGSKVFYPSVTDSDWHCYGFVLDNNDSMHIYLDGVKVNSGVSTQSGSIATNVDYCSLGRHRFTNPGTNLAGWFNGLMNDFSAYDCALSPQDISDLCSGDTVPIVPGPCLVSSYPLEGNAIDTASGYNGTVNGAIATMGSDSLSGTALLFDGQDDYLTLNNNLPIIDNGPFAIVLKARMDGAGGGVQGASPLFSQRTNQTSAGGSIVSAFAENTSGQISFVIRDANNAISSKVFYPAQTDGAWHCYGFVLDSNDSMHIYLDGVKVVSGLNTQQHNFDNNIQHVQIGTHSYSSGGSTIHNGFFNGVIDDFMIFRCVINPDSLCGSLPVTPVDTNPPCLAASYPLDGDAIDTLGNFNGVSYGAVATLGSDSINGNALQFDGVDDFLALNNNEPIIEEGPFTIMVNARMDSTGGGIQNASPLFTQRTNQTSAGGSIVSAFAENTTGQISFVLRDSISAISSKVFYPAQKDGLWHCYGFVLDNSDSMHIYLDGVRVASGHSTQQNDYDNNIQHVQVGTHSYFSGGLTIQNGFFNGALDNFKIYRCAMSPSDFRAVCDIKQSIPNGINKYQASRKIEIYPNPASENVYVRGFEDVEDVTYSVFDILGQEIQSGTLTNGEINISELNSGVYLLILNGEEVSTTRLVVE